MDTNATDTTAVGFTGWLRVPPGIWKPVATGPDRADVQSRLDAAAALHQHADVTLLVAGVNPNQRRRGFR